MTTPPPFDREFATFVSPPLLPADIPAARAERAEFRLTDAELSRGGMFTVEDHRDTPVPLLILRPVAFPAARGCIYWIHGGGMVLGDNRSGVLEALDWAEEFGLVVVSVDYRLAPEHPHPAPVEDCYAGLEWTASRAAELGFDPERLIVAGGSAGGGLAAAVALMARDRGGPALRGQLLLCPMLDDRNDSFSVRQMAGVDTWDRTSNATGWGALLGDAVGGPDTSPYAAPARATDLSGLPPAYLDVGSAESFRDEDVAYANRLWQAGGDAELHVWPGGFHGFDSAFPEAVLSRDARAARFHWLNRLLAP
ncbi:alpha/beta hydrolase [Actinoplanes sp. RD1]|uniref:alpha/beta hydrolase n=1 Tax=Actinoplanes sp. RD1 TaxID=3064538 RepID=UPI002741498E|nr:alpha/beta hydrolase [Actinoplanes sp. RD1]